MKSINGIIRSLYEQTLAYGEEYADENYTYFHNVYSEDIADMFFFSDLCENKPEMVEDWIYENISEIPEVIERLSACIIKKVARDSKKWLEQNNLFNTFMRTMKAGA